MPKRIMSLLQQWEQALILGSIKLEALILHADAVPCPPCLRCLPNLKYVELILGRSEAWAPYFFVDLSFCASLEFFKITQGDLNIDNGSSKLPEVQLSHIPNLKHVEFMGWFPEKECTLPPECELCVTVSLKKMSDWDEQWKAMQKQLTVLSLGVTSLQEWPTGLNRFTRLQYFRLQCTAFQQQDLAVLKAIPNVRLWIWGMASLTLTDGAWENLEVHGEHGLCITFLNAGAFVRGTDRFLFSSKGNVDIFQPLWASIREACSRQLKPCYQCKFRDKYGEQVVRLSNCEDAMCLEPLSDGETVPSGGLHDGYAGTPEDSALWESLKCKHIVSSADVWPMFNPHEWLFGF